MVSAISRRKVGVLLGDVALAVSIAGTSWWFIGGSSLATVVEVSAILPLSLYLAGLYERRRTQSHAMLLAQTAAAIVIVPLLVSMISYLVPGLHIPLRSLLLMLALVLLALPAWRTLADRLFQVTIVPKKVAVVGAGYSARTLVSALEASDEYRVVSLYDDDAAKWGQVIGSSRVLGPTKELLSAHNGTRPDVVAVAVNGSRTRELITTLVECRRQGFRVTDMVQAFEAATGRLPVDHLSQEWVAFSSELLPVRVGLQYHLKRALDVAGALVLLVALSLPLALGALAVALSSPGPILFRQRRVGQDGNEFDVLKLRTMRVDAERDTGPVWCVQGDTRLTPVGGALRRFRIDEIPQLWNVLLGQMSLVGPRPERPEFVRMLNPSLPFYQFRHIAKPGLTGWAQVSYPYGSSLDDARRKLEYDLYYIRHMGPIFDIRILLKTVHVMLFAQGGR